MKWFEVTDEDLEKIGNGTDWQRRAILWLFCVCSIGTIVIVVSHSIAEASAERRGCTWQDSIDEDSMTVACASENLCVFCYENMSADGVCFQFNPNECTEGKRK